MTKKRMRTTTHNGRLSKKGKAFGRKHNDRNFDVEKADNIDPSRTRYNLYYNVVDGWYRDSEKGDAFTFEESEMVWYSQHMRPAYDRQCERYRSRGQECRVKSFTEWCYNRKHCPEESYFQVGSTEDGTVAPETIEACGRDMLSWMQEWTEANGNPFTVLNAAFHYDETIPQFHVRRVWTYEDEDGNREIGQEKALEAAGVSLPEPGEKVGQFNHRKITFDDMARKKWFEILEEHGVEVEREPLVRGRSKGGPGKKSRTKGQWIAEQKAELKAWGDAVYAGELKAQQMLTDAQNAETLAMEHQKRLEAREGVLKASETALEKRETALEKSETALERDRSRMEDRKKELDDRETKLDERARNLDDEVDRKAEEKSQKRWRAMKAAETRVTEAAADSERKSLRDQPGFRLPGQ